jgi:hypothetical protein
MQFEEFTNALNFLYRRVCGGMRRFLLLHLSSDCKENKHKQKWRARKCTCIIKVIRSSHTSRSWIRFLLSLNLPRILQQLIVQSMACSTCWICPALKYSVNGTIQILLVSRFLGQSNLVNYPDSLRRFSSFP